MMCPCGSGNQFENCCGPLLAGVSSAETAEQLMRSRYTAYTKADIDYLRMTLAPESSKDFDAAGTKKWAEDSKWKSLKILKTEKGSTSDKKGTVEFLAIFEQEGKTYQHHEVSEFRKNEKGQWLFVDGEAHTHEGEGDHHHHHPKIETVVRESEKIGRNDPCPCGSGKKYKKCCAAA